MRIANMPGTQFGHLTPTQLSLNPIVVVHSLQYAVIIICAPKFRFSMLKTKAMYGGGWVTYRLLYYIAPCAQTEIDR